MSAPAFWLQRTTRRLVIVRDGVASQVVPLSKVRTRKNKAPFWLLEPAPGGARIALGPFEREITMRPADVTPSAPEWLCLTPEQAVRRILGIAVAKASAAQKAVVAFNTMLRGARLVMDVGGRIASELNRVVAVIEQSQARGS